MLKNYVGKHDIFTRVPHLVSSFTHPMILRDIAMTASIRPFQIAIEDTALEDLHKRISSTRWPDSETCKGWDQGIPLEYSRELAQYWVKDYDWRRCETMLNNWPNYMASIDGQDIHFIHRTSTHANALPLIISHGWPGSVIEFHKIIDALAQPEQYGGDPADAFHVVAPSLPGFGFSSKPTTTGTKVEKIGAMWGKLMAELGYDSYVAQGG
ncbi:MAG: alpha/beta fold hydrolase, partial [Halieaceae bacterium]|nr:alpha/beta fold hydrolase [Halieaceae bacterium]